MNMSLSLYIQCVAMFIIGQVIVLMLDTVPTMRKLSKAANKPFSLKEWFKSEWNIVIGTQAIGAVVILGLDQLLQIKPEIMNYIKWFFAGLGAFGTTVIVSKFSQFKKAITNLLDIKSNVADAMGGGGETVREVKENYEQKTGDTIEGGNQR